MKNYFYFIILIIFCTCIAACKKTNNNKPKNTPDNLSGLWLCNGNEEDIFTQYNMEKVWNGYDSVWTYVEQNFDIFTDFPNRLIKILNLGNGRVLLTNLIFDNPPNLCDYVYYDTSLNSFDTLDFQQRDTLANMDTYYNGCQGIHGGWGVDVTMKYDYLNNKINLVYDWYKGIYHNGSYIRLNGVKN